MGKKSKNEEIYVYVWLIPFANSRNWHSSVGPLYSNQNSKKHIKVFLMIVNIKVMFYDCNGIKLGIIKKKTMKKICEKCPLEIQLLANLTNYGVFTEGHSVSVFMHFKEVTRVYFHWQGINMNSSDITKRHIESKPKFLHIQTKHGRNHFAMNGSFNWV